MFLRLWAWAYVRSLYSCICSFVLAYAGMFLRFCIHKDGLTYVGFDPRMRDSWQKPYFAHFYPFFNRFTPICSPNTPFCHFYTWISLYHSFYLHSCIENIIFHYFCLNEESNVVFPLVCSLQPFMLVREVLIRWCNNKTFSPTIPRPTTLPFWCNSSLKGGGTPPTPFRRWWWLSTTSTTWSALTLKGLLSTWMVC